MEVFSSCMRIYVLLCICGSRVYVSVCVKASMQADVSLEVSARQAVGPHGLSETDRISISLAVGLYSSMGKSVCMCVCVGVFCGDRQHLLGGQLNVLLKHESQHILLSLHLPPSPAVIGPHQQCCFCAKKEKETDSERERQRDRGS